MNYRNTCVWITGGGSGIGAALAHAYWRKGAKVAISGRRLEKLQATIAEYEISAEQALAVECDVRDAANVERAVETILSTWGRIDIVIANAGYAVTGKFEGIASEQWQGQFDTNVMG